MPLAARHTWIAAAAFTLAILACSAPAASSSNGPATQVVIIEPPGATEAPPLPATAAPTATTGPEFSPQTVPPPSGPVSGSGTAEFGGVTFTYPYSLSARWEAEEVPAYAGSGGPDQPVPKHTQFTFPTYPITTKFQQPRLLIFPVAAWQSLSPEASDSIGALQQLLADKPTSSGNGATVTHIPVLPNIVGSQMITSKVAYQSSPNGTGERFLTQFGLAIDIINNAELVYVYQGVTSDGRYHIAAFFPVTHPSLPVVSGDLSSITDFNAYLLQTEQMLDAQPDTTFYPDLTLLDQMIQSVQVK